MAIQGFNRSNMRQISVPIDFLLAMNQEYDLPKMDDILRTSFEIELEVYRGIDLALLTEDEKIALAYVWRVVHLGRSLLQALKIPCFDAGYVSSLQKIQGEKAQYKVTLMVPIVESIPLVFIERCYAQAFVLLAQLCKSGISDADRKVIFETLKDQFTEPLAKKIQGGKSTIPLLWTAHQKNIPFSHLGHGFYQLGWGYQAQLFDRSAIERDSAIGLRISHNKFVASQLFRLNGIPTSDNRLVSSVEEAIHAAKHIGFPVVIKPADKDRGEGVTVDIVSETMIPAAFEKAAQLSKNILVEKKIPGVCHRILIANSHVLYTVRRLPKSVVGDGRQTVMELVTHEIEKENKKVKYKRLEPFVIDDLALQTIQDQGYAMDAVPEMGAFVALRPIESTEWGGTPDVIADIHPENIRIAIEAAQLMRLTIAGVDLISEDVRIPWYENGAAINEVNFAPSLSIRHDYQRQALANILDRLFPSQGRIPIEVYVGGMNAFDKAKARHLEQISAGTRCFLASHKVTYSDEGEMRLAFQSDSLFQRCRALLMNARVEHLILVIQTDELAVTGLPVDLITRIEIVDNVLTSHTQSAESVDDNTVQKLMALLDHYRVRA